jgi:L-serine dehydratase
VLLGLEGDSPATVDIKTMAAREQAWHGDKQLRIGGDFLIESNPDTDLLWLGDRQLPRHTNGLRFIASASMGRCLLRADYYSVGGGFVVDEHGRGLTSQAAPAAPLPFVFASADELLALCDSEGLSLVGLMRHNENAWRGQADTEAALRTIWQTMRACVARGLQQRGILPGGLRVQRRAADLHRALMGGRPSSLGQGLDAVDWLNLWALAVNEENAAGGRVVTAPTNGAAGIVPAVLHYYERFVPGASEQGVFDFLLAAAAIGTLFPNAMRSPA